MNWLNPLIHVPFVLNSDMIVHLEITPDTVIFLTDGQKIVVRESADEIIERVREYRRSVFQGVVPVLETGK